MSMKVPLFVDGKFCLSLDELKGLLSRVSVEKGTLYDELLVAVSDRILERWLMDGSDVEKGLARILAKHKEPRMALNALCLELDIPTVL